MPLPDCYCWLLYTLIYKLEIYLASQGRIHPPTSDLCDSAIWRTISVPTNVQNKAWMLQNLAAPHGLLIFELSLGIEDDLLLLWFCGFPRLLLRPTWEPLIFLVGWVVHILAYDEVYSFWLSCGSSVLSRGCQWHFQCSLFTLCG